MAIKFQSSGKSSGRKSPYQLAVEEVQADIHNQSLRALEAVKKGTTVPLGMEEVSEAAARNKLRSGPPEVRETFLKDNGRDETLNLLDPRTEDPAERPLPLGNTLGNNGGFA